MKAKGTCTLAVPKPLHPRIIKAVTNSKYKDIGYRIEQAENKHRPILSHKSEQSRLRFWLREHYMYECMEEIDV